MGLRLAAFEALQHGGFVEFGADASEQPAGWRVRLVVPLEEAPALARAQPGAVDA
jgi:hypothetical protein